MIKCKLHETAVDHSECPDIKVGFFFKITCFKRVDF